MVEDSEKEGVEVVYGWHRCATEPDDNAEWTAVESTEERYVLTATDVGCWVFGEWRLTDKEGEVPPSSRWERFREKYLRRCFGHAPVDLEYIASQSKMEQAKRAAAEEARLKAGG